MRRLAAWLVVAVAGALVPATASAHAFLDHAEPKVGSTVATSPSALTLVFTEDVEAAFSRIEVLAPDEKPVEVPPPEHPAARTLRVRLPRLEPGTYHVRWKVMSVDSHVTEGSFRFSVGSGLPPRVD